MRRPVIAANWKMHKTHLEAMHFVESLRNRLGAEDYERVEVVICPPFTALRTVQTSVDSAGMAVGLGAQNMFWAESGAYTGEVSAPMLTKLGMTYVILGHSERREVFGETDEGVNRKVKAAFQHGLVPIMCVGETLAERESGGTEAKVEGQVRAGLAGVPAGKLASLVIAYEPIWAIGTGRNAYPDDAQATIAVIRATVRSVAGDVADEVRVQYGGSVKAANVAGFMSQPDIDGALVGGASLDPEEFARIVRYDQAD
ncbi:MAG TPA: triose-phosphate isomerase [Actinomycetota bacterium]|nr:triose-phosphate isomerase [Actinomycetota bacterium]